MWFQQLSHEVEVQSSSSVFLYWQSGESVERRRIRVRVMCAKRKSLVPKERSLQSHVSHRWSNSATQGNMLLSQVP